MTHEIPVPETVANDSQTWEAYMKDRGELGVGDVGLLEISLDENVGGYYTTALGKWMIDNRAEKLPVRLVTDITSQPVEGQEGDNVPDKYEFRLEPKDGTMTLGELKAITRFVSGEAQKIKQVTEGDDDDTTNP